MPAIVLPETSHSEILGGARIKWTDPLNNGLMFAFAPGASGSITRELARGAMGTAAGTPAFRGDAFGGAKSYSENNTSWVAFPDSAEYDSDDITIFAVVTPRASSGDQSQVVARNYDGSTVPFNLQLQNSIAVLQGFSFFNGTAWKNIAFTAAPVANERVAVAGRNAGGTLAVFKNGRLDASSTGNGACPAGTAGIAVGSYVNDSFGFNGGIHCVYVWRRALSDGEIADLTLKPFKIFETRPRILYFPSAGGGGATGTLAATESGSDTAALTGDVLIDGALAATESGSDTAALTGDVIVQGALAVTESGTDTAAATGLVLVQGALAATESGSDTAALAGLVLVQGSIASVEPGADTASIAGDVLVSGALAASETGSDTAAFTGDASLGIFGSIDAAESGSDSAQVTGLVLIQGGLAVTETGSDTAAITGPAAVSGSIAATETGSDTAAVTGLVLIYGSLATTETGSDTAAVSSFRPTVPGIEYTLPEGKAHYTLPDGRAHYTIAA